MNDLRVFQNPQFGQVRTIDRNGEPWFVAADVCRVLDHSNVTMALDRLDNDERAKLNLGRQGETNIVNEPGLYSLVLGSRKPEARAFKRWITHEVIPAIRKTGAYAVPNAGRFQTADYIKAADALAHCNYRAIDAVYGLLRDAGFHLADLRSSRPINSVPYELDREAIAEKLSELINQHGYSTVDLADSIGCTPMSVWRWTRGMNRPNRTYLGAICNMFGVTADYFK